jgi:shikimate kinase
VSGTVVLVGAPGSGKTTVGVRLAALLGVDFVDTDDLVARSGGAESAAEVLTEQGEQAFRELEREAVRLAMGVVAGAAGSDSGSDAGSDAASDVVAVGGGAVADSEVREALAGHDVVWLRVTAPNALSRTGLNAIRPVALGNIRAQFAAQLKARAPWYEEVSTLAVDTDYRDPDEIAAEVRALLAAPVAPDHAPGAASAAARAQAADQAPVADQHRGTR